MTKIMKNDTYIKSFAKNPGQNGITLAFALSPCKYSCASTSKSISSLVRLFT